MLIECLIKRKNGTEVSFGKNPLRQVVYKFKPKNADDPMSAHVCEVNNEEHIERLLTIKPQAYIKHGEVVEIEEDIDDGDSANFDFSDAYIVELDANETPVKYVEAYARSVLGVNPKDKNAIADIYEKNTGKTFKKNMSSVAMLRECLRDHIADAKNALELAVINDKNKG